MGNLLRRRELILPGESGPIWLFDNGVVYPSVGSFDEDGPNVGTTITATVGDTIKFSPSNISYNAIKTLVSKNAINANGKTLHIVLKTKASDNRYRNDWFYAYASQSVLDATEVPDATDIANYFPDGNGSVYYIPYNNKVEKETEITIPITQDNVHVSIGLLKRYIFLSYASVTQIWVE